ncbi:MAG: transglycosylase SLT domain-containing protein [Deltaproteobacteria bacterium]|nr:transglycosylase SLT domain-containing protein [Deltaproteobacteria bacterium]
MKKSTSLICCFVLTIMCSMMVVQALMSPALAGNPLLSKSIIAYNISINKKSLAKGSYKGQDGIIRISPEVGRSFGLRVLMDRDYLAAKALLKRADKVFEDAVVVMSTHEKERLPDEHVKKIGKLAVYHNELIRSAKKNLMDYRAKLNENNDDRLNKGICSELLERLLEESLTTASYNLRDGLGYFYNLCQNLNINDAPLNSINVRFVNYVFHEFTKKVSAKDMSMFDLDRTHKSDRAILPTGWNYALGRAGSQYIAFVRPLHEEQNKSAYPVNLLLFFALMRQESNFNPHAVSRVGAAGLTQIMPSTAKGLGMKNIFMPAYFKEAGSFMGRERNLRGKAIGLISKINEKNMIEYAKRARSLMQKSLDFKRKRIKLYARYKRDLLKGRTDDRLNPQKAIEHGFRLFARLMQKQNGDISLALASYNAGPHRVKQYKGIPPYDETVGFRNSVLRYYREYMRKLEKFNVSQR